MLPGTGTAKLPSYSGPKANITVGDFEVKAVKATAEIGSGIRQMLVSALINSDRFSIIERQTQTVVIQEEAGKNSVADLILAASVTEFEPQASGGRAGVGGGGGAGSGILGGLLGSALNKAHITLDMRILDASTSKVLAATRLQGQASDISGAIMGGLSGNLSLGTGLSPYAGTPMEKAIRICIIEAVRYASEAIPVTYYKYN